MLLCAKRWNVSATWLADLAPVEFASRFAKIGAFGVIQRIYALLLFDLRAARSSFNGACPGHAAGRSSTNSGYKMIVAVFIQLRGLP
jgi:hypothetical protein